jgi:hypothetical protein
MLQSRDRRRSDDAAFREVTDESSVCKESALAVIADELAFVFLWCLLLVRARDRRIDLLLDDGIIKQRIAGNMKVAVDKGVWGTCG